MSKYCFGKIGEKLNILVKIKTEQIFINPWKRWVACDVEMHSFIGVITNGSYICCRTEIQCHRDGRGCNKGGDWPKVYTQCALHVGGNQRKHVLFFAGCLNPVSRDFIQPSVSLCRNPGEDTKMLVCDMCDKGYHTFCLQPAIDSLPTNGWRCKVGKTLWCRMTYLGQHK